MTDNELRKLCEAATKGPWRACKDGNCSCGLIFGHDGEVYTAKAFGLSDIDDVDPVPSTAAQKANAALIAAAREAIPRLLAEKERLLQFVRDFENAGSDEERYELLSDSGDILAALEQGGS